MSEKYLLLRRIGTHLKEQNWFAVGLDIIVVIVGIFLGMQVTEWNELRKDSTRERAYLIQIKEDIQVLVQHQMLKLIYHH